MITKDTLSLWDKSSDDSLPGYGFEYLEMVNWGLFDGNKIHRINFDRQNTMITGDNGSGKSTLVDAILTLFGDDRQAYNPAAGGKAKERNRNSYVRGAYGTTILDGGGKPTPKFLRPDNNFTSVILAKLSTNTGFHPVFALVVIEPKSNSQTHPSYYVYRGNEEIDLKLVFKSTTQEARKALLEIGVTQCPSFKDYRSRLGELLGLGRNSTRAFEIFIQAVGVKDVENLTQFFRRYMLDEPELESGLEDLKNSFRDIRQCYEEILKTKQQVNLLKAIHGFSEECLKSERNAKEHSINLDALEVFKVDQTVVILRNLVISISREMSELQNAIDRIQRRLETKRLNLEDTLQEETLLNSKLGVLDLEKKLKEKKAELKQRQNHLESFKRWVTIVGRLQEYKEQETGYDHILRLSMDSKPKIEKQEESLHDENKRIILESSELSDERKEAERKLASYKDNSNLIDSRLTRLRSMLCEDLGIQISDLPFAGELMQVKESEKEWEHAANVLLRAFAVTLLVPANRIDDVSRWINRLGRREFKSKLLYDKVVPMRKEFEVQSFDPDSIAGKIEFKKSARLIHWVKYRLSKFHHRCVAIDEFSSSKFDCITTQGLYKTGHYKHVKDNSNNLGDNVLGWNVEEMLSRQVIQLKEIDTKSRQLKELETATRSKLKQLSDVKTAWQAIGISPPWQEVDPLPVEVRILELVEEKESKISKNAKLKQIRTRIKELREKIETEGTLLIDRTTDFKGAQKKRDQYKSDIISNESALEEDRLLLLVEQKGELLKYLPFEKSFPDLEVLNSNTDRVRRLLEKKRLDAESAMNLADKEASKSMALFIDKWTEGKNLTAERKSFEDFDILLNELENERLVEHEEEFKKKLNIEAKDEVTAIDRDIRETRQDIIDKISEINKVLKTLEYDDDSYVEIEQRDITNRIQRDCLALIREAQSSVGLDGEVLSLEERFNRIDKLLYAYLENQTKFIENIDPRNCFQFHGQEKNRVTGGIRNSLAGGAGYSGGQKTRLTYFVLGAAIAYQYGLAGNVQKENTFRAVVIDETFSKLDSELSLYPVKFFKQLGIQLIAVHPLDSKIYTVQDHFPRFAYVGKIRYDDNGQEKEKSVLENVSCEVIRAKVAEQDVISS